MKQNNRYEYPGSDNLTGESGIGRGQGGQTVVLMAKRSGISEPKGNPLTTFPRDILIGASNLASITQTQSTTNPLADYELDPLIGSGHDVHRYGPEQVHRKISGRDDGGAEHRDAQPASG